MTTDDFLSQLWEFLTQWGPVALIGFAILFLIVFSLALTFIIWTWRSIARHDREMDDRLRSLRGGRR